MEGFIFESMEQYDYENLFFCQDKSLGLKAIFAIHDTTLGPAGGGIRMWHYETEDDAIKDALRLARGMTYKWAAAGANLGGGKCVVIGDPKRDKTEGMFRVLGRFMHRLGGLFLAGPDVGTNLRDMEIIRMETQYVVTIPESWGGPGDSSPATAFGVMQGMRACLKEVYGSPDLHGRTVAIQGVGAVGEHLVELLVKEGAVVTLADIEQSKVEQLAHKYDVKVAQRGILYAPDYIVNAGGAISGVDSLNPGGFNRQRATETVSRIYETTEIVIALAKELDVPTYRAADLLAEQRIAMVRQVKSLKTKGDT